MYCGTKPTTADWGNLKQHIAIGSPLVLPERAGSLYLTNLRELLSTMNSAS